jgi:hypothetical protein
MQPIALADGAMTGQSDEAGWIALLCANGATVCSLWRGVTTGYEPLSWALEAVPNGDVPTDAELRGVTFVANWPGPIGARVCAFGDGIFCYNGTMWITEIATGTGAPFNDLGCVTDFESSCAELFAVGDGGRFATFDKDAEEWTEGPMTTDRDLRVVAETAGVVGGEDGLLAGPAGIAPCTVSSSAVVGLSLGLPQLYKEDPADDSVFADLAVLTEPGLLAFTAYDSVAGTFQPFTCGGLDSSGVAPGAALAVRDYYCGIADDRIALTESAVYGEWTCSAE